MAVAVGILIAVLFIAKLVGFNIDGRILLGLAEAEVVLVMVDVITKSF